MDAIEIESLVEQWMKKRLCLWLEIGDLKSLEALEALLELSGSSLGALWELVTVAHYCYCYHYATTRA